MMWQGGGARQGGKRIALDPLFYELAKKAGGGHYKKSMPRKANCERVAPEYFL